MRTASRWAGPVVVVAALVLAGCDPETRDEIADAIDDAVSEAQSAIDQATSEPTDPSTPTPTTDATTEPATEPTSTPTTDAPTEESTTEEPAPEPTTEEPAPEPTTEEPAPTAEETPTPTTAETTPVAEPSAAATDEEVADDGPSWPFIVMLAGLGAALLWLLVALWRRRRRLLAARARLRDAVLTDLDWLHRASREHVAGVDAGTRARDVRLRHDRLTEHLHQLRADADGDVLLASTAVLTSSRHLSDALIARLDDAAAGRDHAGAGLGIPELAGRLRSDRDDLARALGVRPEQV